MTDNRDDHDEEPELPPRPRGEGVRIIGAEEAASKMEAGEAAGRRPPDAPRFGEPASPPSGPRPAHRFPLSGDDEPRPASSPAPRPSDPPTGGRQGSPDLPHWTEPPTGEVPRILPEDEEDPDDMEGWSSLRRKPVWRDSASDWEEDDYGESFGDEDEDLRIEPQDRPEAAAAPWEFAEEPQPQPTVVTSATGVYGRDPQGQAQAGAAEPTRIGSRPEPYDYGQAPTRGGERNLPVAVGTAVGVGALALIAFAMGPATAALLATAVVMLAAVEVFDVFRRAGYRPATLLGLVATGSIMVAAYAKGERAIPLVLALTVVFSMLWYLGGVVRARPTVNLGVTLLAFIWVGFLGSFASLMLRYPDREGVAFLLAAVIAVVANDVGALFSGQQFGNTPLAPEISPNKTVEGYLGGLVVTLIVCGLVVSRISPWGLGSSLLLAVVVGIVAPIGDLCESMIKRDLGIKDMGTLLPGHGGVLDRFDALLFTLPAVYYLVEFLNLAS